MKLRIQIPSKTYLAGEYNILANGSAIIVCSEPYFTFEIEKNIGKHHAFNNQSPTGMFIKKHLSLFSDTSISFTDPHCGSGGYGASGAEFLGAYIAKQFLAQQNFMLDGISTKDILTEYWSYIESPLKPSGGDIAAQINGGIIHYNPTTFHATPLEWQFPNLGFILASTKHITKTHEHLNKLSREQIGSSDNIINTIKLALSTNDETLFIDSLKEFQSYLLTNKFCCSYTHNILEALQPSRGIVTAKGCGALGADVIFIVYELPEKQQVVEYIQQANLTVTATEANIANQTQLQYDTEETNLRVPV